eukprot:scaffold84905_cov42-Phaeocystis_antarctica.AAC.2
MLLLHHPTILPRLPLLLLLLVIRHVQLRSARVPRVVDAAPVRRRQLKLAALVAHRVLLPLIVHVRRQPAAADASEAHRHVRRRAALAGSGWCAALVGSGPGGGGLGSLALLRLQRCQRLADLPGGRSQA